MIAERGTEPTPEQLAEHAAAALERAQHYAPETEETALPLTRSIVARLEPPGYSHVVAFLTGLLNREPLRSGKGWERERLVLGALAADLEFAARAAGEPEAWPMDLRPPEVRRRDGQVLERIEMSRREYQERWTALVAELEAPEAEDIEPGSGSAPEPEPHATVEAAPVPVPAAAEDVPEWFR